MCHSVSELLYLFLLEMIFLAFIIGTYNKYDIWDREHSVYKFEING